MTELEPELEPEFPYVFKCKKCEEQHIAISLQPWMIEWLKGRLERYAKEKRELSDNMHNDKQQYMEAGIASHILEEKIKPAEDMLRDKGLTAIGCSLKLIHKECGASIEPFSKEDRQD